MVLRRDGAVVYGYTTTATGMLPLVLSLISNEHRSTYHIKSNAQHKHLWSVTLTSRPAGGSYNLILASAQQNVSVRNVTFGEWVMFASNRRTIYIDSQIKNIQKDVRVHVVTPNPEPYEQIATKMDPQPAWINLSLLGKTSIGTLAILCARSHQNHHKDIPVGVFVSWYPDSELEAWYPTIDQLECAESRCVGGDGTSEVLTESNYVKCSQRPRASVETFWNPGNSQLYNGMIRPYVLNRIDIIMMYTDKDQAENMACTLDRLSKSWLRSWVSSGHDTRPPFLCIFNTEKSHDVQYRVLPSIKHEDDKQTYLSSSACLSSRIKTIMALEP